MIIRSASPQDQDAIWEIFSAVIQTGDTYVFSPQTPRSKLGQYWFADYMHTYVAEDKDQIVGTYMLKPNQVDLGSHVANASYMVHPDAQRHGIGSQMCEHSLRLAKELGYTAMQFNIVVSTNQAAVMLWKKYGFEIIGTTPKGFNHQILGLVDTYIMYKAIDTRSEVVGER